MSNIIEKFIEWAKINDWSIKYHNEVSIILPTNISARYPSIPEDFFEFISVIDTMVTPDEVTWFLSMKDYTGDSDSAFCWNEFEKISLEAAEDDEEWIQEIIEFWDRFLPIILSVENGYSYYAIDTKSPSGRVIYGCEPEFEEVEEVAKSFSDFLELINTKTINL